MLSPRYVIYHILATTVRNVNLGPPRNIHDSLPQSTFTRMAKNKQYNQNTILDKKNHPDGVVFLFGGVDDVKDELFLTSP